MQTHMLGREKTGEGRGEGGRRKRGICTETEKEKHVFGILIQLAAVSAQDEMNTTAIGYSSR